MNKRTPTTKDVALLKQLLDSNQLVLTAEFQRNAVWPRAAKAYLIDTILNDKPVPLLFSQRETSTQTATSKYVIIDGQQRLRAIFEYMDDRFALSESKGNTRLYNKYYSELSEGDRVRLLSYDLMFQELSGYSKSEVEDIFARMNKYVVRLNPQELRHAKLRGAFHKFAEQIGRHSFWKKHRVFSPTAIKRMKPTEFSAELAILLIEGPQDKKSSIDLYYENYYNKFSARARLAGAFDKIFAWITAAMPDLGETGFRSPTDLYSLVGAIQVLQERRIRVSSRAGGRRLAEFAQQLGKAADGSLRTPPEDVAVYLLASQSQTDNLLPRQTRIDVLVRLLSR